MKALAAGARLPRGTVAQPRLGVDEEHRLDDGPQDIDGLGRDTG